MVEGWIASPGAALQGAPAIPGDKSVSHRAVMLASIAEGSSRIEGFLEGADARATCDAFARMGVRIEVPTAGVRVVHGVGLDGLRAPGALLDCGNAGTAMRLMAGLLCGQRFDSVLVGDASLSRRPMGRVMAPLARMGARIDAAPGSVPPLRIHGNNSLQAIDFENEVASAQVKSAVLLAGLYGKGETRVREPRPTRDYTERMLQAFGAEVDFRTGEASVHGRPALRATDVFVPSDFSSAAFLLVAATLVPGSSIVLRGIGVDERRTGLLRVLRRMGADVIEVPVGSRGGMTVADLQVRHAPLHGVAVDAAEVADMIDEFPVLFVAAACAEGSTTVRGAAELRIKESDRIATMAMGLRALGIRVDEMPDGATIHGGRLRGGRVDSQGDHRVAMAFAVAGQMAGGEVRIDDVANADTSFPGFAQVARGAGFGIAQATTRPA